MTLVGYAPGGRGGAVLHLAGMLARSAQEELLIRAVIPSPGSRASWIIRHSPVPVVVVPR
jgi:hypothetical protein